MAGTENKTQPEPFDAERFFGAVEHPVRQEDSRALDALFREVTGWAPQLWGGSIVGYGTYHYRYDSGREGDFLATGFAPRKSNLSIYIMPGYQDYGNILARLGKHKTGAACLYVNKLSDIDMVVLGELVRAGLSDLQARYPVRAS